MSSETKPTNDLTQEVTGQHERIGNTSKPVQEFARTTHPDAQWFPEAGLGLFIHWGISTTEGEGDISWSMMARGPKFREETGSRYGDLAVQKTYTPEAYWKLAEKFNPQKYDANKWLSAAAKAGFKYAVLTTKHHDGYTLWPSKFGDLGTHTHLAGRDLVADYVKACRDNGLKVCFYYSPPDWRFERDVMSFNYSGPDLDTKHQPRVRTVRGIGQTEGELSEAQKAHDATFRAHVHGQVEELLTRYGKIDMIWFDGSGHDSISAERIRELQPGIVINPRAHGVGDFKTFECSFPKTRPEGWWEYCHIMNDGAWSYLKHEIYRPIGWLTSEYAKTIAWGGNFLPNVGPNGDGELPEVYYKRLEQLAAWLKHSGVSVQGAGPGPDGVCNVPITTRGDTWYLHVLLQCPNAVELKAAEAPKSVKLLRTGGDLPWTQENGVIKIEVHSDLRTVEDDVIEVIWK